MSIWGNGVEGGWDEWTGVADSSREDLDRRHDKLLKELLGVLVVLTLASMLVVLKAMV